MKRIALIALCALFVTRCVQVYKFNTPTSGEYLNNPDHYNLLGNKREEISCLWVLGIGKNQETMKNQVLNNMLTESRADGVFMGTYFLTETRFLLWRTWKAELTGQPYVLKAPSASK